MAPSGCYCQGNFFISYTNCKDTNDKTLEDSFHLRLHLTFGAYNVHELTGHQMHLRPAVKH